MGVGGFLGQIDAGHAAGHDHVAEHQVDAVILAQDRQGRRAVFLPQVATEQGWGRDTFLDRLCGKAGLPAGCWREGARLSVFTAQVFGEEEAAAEEPDE